MQSKVSYVPYAKCSHEQTGGIITFVQFKYGGLLENEHNFEEYESILDSIEKSSADDNSDDRYIITDSLEDIWYGSYVHKNINAIDARLKICGCIRQ